MSLTEKHHLSQFFLFLALRRINPPTLDARIYDKVKVLLLFIGYNRSRHTLLSSLLDAHPHVIIANDFNILQQWIDNSLMLSKRNKHFIYELLLAKSRYDAMYGVRSRKLVDGRSKQYHYNVKGQWQGQYNASIQVSCCCCCCCCCCFLEPHIN